MGLASNHVRWHRSVHAVVVTGSETMKIEDRYESVEAIPKRMEHKNTEYGMICQDNCSPAQRYIDRVTGVERNTIGGFYPAGYWSSLVRGQSMFSYEVDRDRARKELASWFRMPVELAEKLLKMPVRVCMDWGDVLIDFGTRENLEHFIGIIRHHDKMDKHLNKIDWDIRGEEE